MALSHRHLGIGLDRRPLLPVDGDDLGQAPHAERVEGVVLVERMEGRLVEALERHRFEHQTVLRQVRTERLGDFGGILPALVLQLVHRIAGGHRQKRVHQLAFQRLGQLRGPERLAAERLAGGCHAFRGGLNPDIELDADVDPQAVLGDHRLRPQALDLEARGLHVDFRHLVQERHRDAAAI